MKVIFLFLISLSMLPGQIVLDFPSATIRIWPEFAPGETEENVEKRMNIRGVQEVFYPTLTLYSPAKGTAAGAAVVVIPDGNSVYQTQDFSLSQARRALQKMGIAVFVLSRRSAADDSKAPHSWKRPLQDSQRAIRYLRAHKDKYDLDPKKIGILGFLAGGQIAAIHMGEAEGAYEKIDSVDLMSARPDFAMLIYPWHIYDEKTGKLRPEIKLGANTPPTFLVHADDGDETSLGAVSIYTELKRSKVSAELHLYQNGGYLYGYQTRSPDGSIVRTWPLQAAQWLGVRLRGIGK